VARLRDHGLAAPVPDDERRDGCDLPLAETIAERRHPPAAVMDLDECAPVRHVRVVEVGPEAPVGIGGGEGVAAAAAGRREDALAGRGVPWWEHVHLAAMAVRRLAAACRGENAADDDGDATTSRRRPVWSLRWWRLPPAWSRRRADCPASRLLEPVPGPSPS